MGGLPPQVARRLSGRPFRCYIRLGQPTVNNKVCGVDETALIARQEYHSVCLFNSLAETPSREMNLAPEPSLLVIAQEVLEHRGTSEWLAFSVFTEVCGHSLKWSRAQRVEPVSWDMSEASRR